MHTVSIDRTTIIREAAARDWLRTNAVGNDRWSISAWRIIPEPGPRGANGQRSMIICTRALVVFQDGIDAALFAIWAGGKLL